MTIKELQEQFNDVNSAHSVAHEKVNDGLQHGDLVAAQKYTEERNRLGKPALELQEQQQALMPRE